MAHVTANEHHSPCDKLAECCIRLAKAADRRISGYHGQESIDSATAHMTRLVLCLDPVDLREWASIPSDGLCEPSTCTDLVFGIVSTLSQFRS